MATPHDKEGLLQEPLSRFSQPAATPGRCQYCGGLVQAQGRRKKRFCRDLCRTRYHHALRRARLGQLQERLAEAEAVIEQAQALADHVGGSSKGSDQDGRDLRQSTDRHHG